MHVLRTMLLVACLSTTNNSVRYATSYTNPFDCESLTAFLNQQLLKDKAYQHKTLKLFFGLPESYTYVVYEYIKSYT